MANGLKADLVALTGDMVDGTVERLKETVAPLASLQPSGRVYYVLGNHEYYSGPRQWIKHFTHLGARTLLNEGVDLEHKGAPPKESSHAEFMCVHLVRPSTFRSFVPALGSGR